ncbi:hypothetical protein JRO89_XS09G0152900 [Xanthoceras sorbifolium]|uniref:Cation/H+ exchanger domain-containing protein n=1 Tax=Xanthoceras sorbifolium TaxID=99658 RepID=A0ABQ8HLI4_9ROSI|nr:hypothetical protein JRO89_XS09G0152900 [Xanthoceras sorbifolium]
MVNNLTQICITLPPKVQSPGLGRLLMHDENADPSSTTSGYDWYNKYALPRLETHIALIFAVTQIIHLFLKRLGLPLFTSQLIAGMILSKAIPWTDEGVQIIGTLGIFGYGLFLFLSGVKMDPSMVFRVNKRSWYIGLLSMLVPLLSMLPIMLHEFDEKDKEDQEVDPKLKTLFLLPYYSLTSLPVINVLLSELKILNSELGRIALSSAVIGDHVSMFLMITGNVLRVWTQIVNHKVALGDLGCVIAFLVVVAFVLRPAMLAVVKRTPEGKPVYQSCIYALMLLFLGCLCVTRWFDQFLLLAPYILGLAVPHGPPLGSALVEKFEGMVENLFMPLFVTSCALRLTTMTIDFNNKMTWVNASIGIVALLVKFVVSLIPPLYNKMPKRDAAALALIMSSKALLTWPSSLSSVIEQGHFTFMFWVIICVANIVPILVKCLYDPSRKYAGYNKRNLMYLRCNAELPIVAVIHVPDNVNSVINLLEATCPTKDNPMTINVIHLIKLSGLATPIFISHQKRLRTTTSDCYSENVIVAFNKFIGNNWGAVSVNTFTAVSLPSIMHEDICSLALDKLASLIILPFHRRWYIDGSVESDDELIRALNSRVLERAPCSVGILIDRVNLRRAMPVDGSSEKPSYRVAMIFLGGNDDREALTFAKRMAQESTVVLTVAHFSNAENNQGISEDWDRMHDSIMLREVKTNGYINYVEKEVADGPETATIIHNMVNEYDMIIVGRRNNEESQQTTGLKEWSECPELGVWEICLHPLIMVVDAQFWLCNNKRQYFCQINVCNIDEPLSLCTNIDGHIKN